MVEAELRSIQIVTSPYTIHFTKTPKYFKPGMSFDVAAEVVNPDETPAQGVVVRCRQRAGLYRSQWHGKAHHQYSRRECKTDNQPERQARASMTAVPYATKSNNYIHIVSQFKEKLERDCCLDGMQKSLLSCTCERCSEYINDGAACVAAFLHCCKEMESQRAEMKEDSLRLARSEEEDNSYMDSNEIGSCTKFPESWLWSDIKLPTCPRQSPNCDTTSFTKKCSFARLNHNLAVHWHQSVTDYWLPYSAVPGEQLKVRVDLIEKEHVCSSASKRGKYRQEVNIGPLTTRSVPFIIILMKDGHYPVEVKAAVKDSSLNDGIMKMLRVVPEGVLIKHPQIVTLDPTNTGVGGKQEETLNSGIPKKDLAPNTPTSTQISVTGREQVAALVENAISGKSMGSLIYQPSGCGEQNMIHMTLPVIATTYLDKTN
ncbi:hypothetical protein ABVT39_011963 [Epinephelus coioides]